MTHSNKDLESGACVAIKRCVYASSVRHEAGLPANALREINVLRETNHPNIIKLLDVQWLENTSVDLVFEVRRGSKGFPELTDKLTSSWTRTCPS